MTAPVAILLFVGLLLATLGLFAAGSLPLIGLGVVALIAAGALDVAATKRA